MPSDQERWKTSPESRRIAHPQKIYLKFPNSDKYVEEYLVDLSMTGMFVRCLSPAPPGTVFDFRMRLVSGGRNVEGRASVVWVRTEQQRLSHPKGMGVRFLALDEESQRQIRETVERYAQDPETPHEMHTLRSVVEETLGEVLGPEIRDGSGPWREMKRPDPPVAPPLEELPEPVRVPSAASRKPVEKPRPPIYDDRIAVSASRSGVPWLPLAVGLLLLAILGVAGYFLRDRLLHPGLEAEEGGVELPVPVPAVPPASPAGAAVPLASPEGEAPPILPSEPSGSEAPVPEPGAPAPPTEPEPAAGPTPQELVGKQVLEWARAWSRQEVDAYLDFYARDFSPSRGLSGPQWRRQRRDRLSQPSFIEVEVKELRVDSVRSDRIRTRFVQFYRSDSFSDTDLKVLEWEFEGDGWKIVLEQVEN
ncbi:MAG: PilZ domain-containing protein [Acidobacteria bacterium]|nr:PilZ domain-containing protein [Acidobacteriota bacterium]